MWDGTAWSIYASDGIAVKTGVAYVDLSVLAVDPKDETHLFAGGRTGLYEYKDQHFIKHYGPNNSILGLMETLTMCSYKAWVMTPNHVCGS